MLTLLYFDRNSVLGAAPLSNAKVLGLAESRLAHTALRTVRSAFNWDLGAFGLHHND